MAEVVALEFPGLGISFAFDDTGAQVIPAGFQTGVTPISVLANHCAGSPFHEAGVRHFAIVFIAICAGIPVREPGVPYPTVKVAGVGN